jgi:galactonate dehydratase
MKLDSVKVFLVSNPPPGFGGRYFVFLKLKTACGVEGVGEVYCATFGPKVVGKMIEDLFARRFAGRDPFQIESLWRESYGSGFSLRPDISLLGVISGLEMACWDIIGKAVEQPIYNLMGGKVNERLRSYTYLYPAAGEGDDFYHDADRSAARAAEYAAQGFTGLKFDPTGGFSAYDPRQPTQEALERTVRLVRLVREAVGRRADLLVGTHGQFTTSGAIRLAKQLEPYDPLWFEEPVPPEMPEQMAIVARGTSIPIATGERLTTKYEFARVLAERRGQHHSNEPGQGRRLARGEKSGGIGGSALRADRAASLLRPGGGSGQHSDRDLLAQFLDPRKHPAMGRHPRAAAAHPDSLGTRLCDSAHHAGPRG